jgi:hypothetical protein
MQNFVNFRLDRESKKIEDFPVSVRKVLYDDIQELFDYYEKEGLMEPVDDNAGIRVIESESEKMPCSYLIGFDPAKGRGLTAVCFLKVLNNDLIHVAEVIQLTVAQSDLHRLIDSTAVAHGI